MLEISRRRFLQGAGGLAASSMAFPATTRVFAQDNRITVTSLGGAWEQSIRNHFIPLFQERTGATVEVVLGGPTQWMTQIQAQPGQPPIDAIDNSETLAFELMDADMAVQLTHENCPNLADVPDLFRKPWDDYGVMYMYAAAGFAYNKDRIANPPTSWTEFFERTAAGEFGQAVSLPDIGYAWTPAFIWTFAEVLGGGIDNLDPGFEVLRRMRPNIAKFWGGAGEIERMLSSGEVDIAVFWDGRSYAMASAGANFLGFQRPDSHNLISGVTSQVVKGGNEALALEYVNTLLDPAPQRQYFDLINYAVTNSKVEYPEAVRHQVLPAANGVVAPYRQLGRMTAEIVDRWNNEIRL